MNPRADRFSLPPSVVISLILVILAGALAALHPADEVRRIGWTLTLIMLALLLISIGRIIWMEFREMRAALIVHLTECSIRGREDASRQQEEPSLQQHKTEP